VGEPVLLNVYDLSPANEHTRWLGFGAYHSGVEVFGTEYTFGQGGVFSTTPKDAPGARLCETIILGEVYTSHRDVERVVDELRASFPPGSYHLLKKNCNSFSNALSARLLSRAIPGWVNRSATLAQWCSCLMPEDTFGSAPVDAAPSASGGEHGFHVMPGRRGRSAPREVMTFAGGGSDSFTSPADSAPAERPTGSFAPSGGRRLAEAVPLTSDMEAASSSSLWSFLPSSEARAPQASDPSSTTQKRREMMLQAALARRGDGSS
jgi:hypothetical protein